MKTQSETPSRRSGLPDIPMSPTFVKHGESKAYPPDIVEVIFQTIRDQGLDPGRIKVLRDTMVKEGFITDRFCFYRYMDEDMDCVPTSVSMDQTDTPVPMDMVRESDETSSQEPEVTVIKRTAFEPLSGTPSTPMARSTSDNSQRGLGL